MNLQLFHAASIGRTEIIQTYLSQDVNVNLKDSYGNTLLHVAVENGQADMLQFLINVGADFSIQNNTGETVMNKALLFGRKYRRFKTTATCDRMINILFEAGAEANIACKNEFDVTVLHNAASIDNANVVRHLIRQGADVHAIDVDGWWTPLHYAAFYVSSESPAVFEVLLSANADANVKTEFGETPIHMLAGLCMCLEEFSFCKIFEVFKKYGANFNAQDEDGKTPMDVAIWGCNYEAVKALISVGGVGVNSKYSEPQRNPDGSTILHGACCSFQALPIIKFLIKNGANVDAVDDDNRSPLKCVIDSIDEANILVYGEEFEYETREKIKYLLKYNADVNIITNQKLNILTPSSGEKLPATLWQTVVQHIAKLLALERSIDESILDTIHNNRDYKIYFEKCKEELVMAKCKKLHANSYVTPFNVLMDDKKKLFFYAGNRDLGEEFTGGIKILLEYPVYGVAMCERFKKAMEKREIWNGAAVELSGILHLDGVDPAIRKILNFLDLKDLKKLCE